jgi:hypothetical protein
MDMSLSPSLNAHLSALDAAPSEMAVETAQRKLESRIATMPSATFRRPWIGWVAATASACLVLVLAMLPASRGIAFATVQKHLADFSTLTLLIDQQSQGMTLPGIRVRMNHQGDVRTDVGDASSTIVSPRNHRMLTLLHDSHMAMPLPLDASVHAGPGDNLAWLDAIRRFQGEAKPLAGTKLIDGRRVAGWALDTEGMHIVLWADSDGLPRAVEINHGQLLKQHMQVTVDAPIDAAVFSTELPPGYAAMKGDGD